MKAIDAVLKNERFKLSTPIHQKVLETGKKLHSWCLDPSNSSVLSSFAKKLHAKLKTPFSLSQGTSKFQKRRAKMWGEYYTLRVTEEFITDWKKFLGNARCEAVPYFFQNVTDNLFKELIANSFRLDEEEYVEGAVQLRPLTYLELNGLRYGAGFVCRKLCDRIKRSKSAQKELTPEGKLLMLSVGELLEDRDDMDYDMPVPPSCEWIERIDRGGLLHVNDDTFATFVAMEEVIRDYFRVSKVLEIADGKRKEILDRIKHDPDVQEEWSFLSNDMPQHIADQLLSMMAEQWLTSRGHSFASAFMELHKQHHKKTLGAGTSKGLRKTLVPQSK